MEGAEKGLVMALSRRKPQKQKIKRKQTRKHRIISTKQQLPYDGIDIDLAFHSNANSSSIHSGPVYNCIQDFSRVLCHFFPFIFIFTSVIQSLHRCVSRHAHAECI